MLRVPGGQRSVRPRFLNDRDQKYLAGIVCRQTIRTQIAFKCNAKAIRLFSIFIWTLEDWQIRDPMSPCTSCFEDTMKPWTPVATKALYNPLVVS